MYRFYYERRRGLGAFPANATELCTSLGARSNVALTCRSVPMGSKGAYLHGPAVLNGPGLRVRPPPSLLRGLQAPPDSLSPFGGAASF